MSATDLWGEMLARRNPVSRGARRRAREIGNLTYRRAGAVGPRALVPEYVRQTSKRGELILDFGSGTHATHAKKLRQAGLNVVAWDIEQNFLEGVHDPGALRRRYSTVYASNVLNVQEDPELLAEVLDLVQLLTKPRGRAVVNLPASPRYGAWQPFPSPAAELEHQLGLRFKNVSRVGGTAAAPVLEARGPLPVPPSLEERQGARMNPPQYESSEQSKRDWKRGRSEAQLEQIYEAFIVPVTDRARPLVRSVLWSPPRTEGQVIDFAAYLSACFPGDLLAALTHLQENRYAIPKVIWRDPDVLRAAEMLTEETKRRTRSNPIEEWEMCRDCGMAHPLEGPCPADKCTECGYPELEHYGEDGKYSCPPVSAFPTTWL